MTFEQRQRLNEALTKYAIACGNRDAAVARGDYNTGYGRVCQERRDEVMAIVAEVDDHKGPSTIEQALDFFKAEFGEFLLIARLADKERHVVLAVADDEEGYERLATLVRKYAAGELAADEISLDEEPTS